VPCQGLLMSQRRRQCYIALVLTQANGEGSARQRMPYVKNGTRPFQPQKLVGTTYWQKNFRGYCLE